MADTIGGALVRLRRGGLEQHLPASTRFEQLCREQGHHWRRRLFTPLLTLRLFVLQVLHGNIAINALRQLSGLSFAAASYCEARTRLPLAALQQLLAELSDAALAGSRCEQAPGSAHVYAVDSSTGSMPDTPALRKHFGLPAPRRAGVAHPMSMIMGLLDLHSGLFMRAVAMALFVSDLKGALSVHEALGSGDILVGDRAFCSFAHIELLNRRGVFCCFRLHKSRAGERLGKVRWVNGRHRPPWMSKRLFATMPKELTLRIVRHRIKQKGYRTSVVLIATTLMEVEQWSEQRVADLYRQRWDIETCFGYLKTTMKMDILKCKSVDGVMKEMAVYLIVYNLVRLVMLQWAEKNGVPARRVSFIDALRLLSVRAMGLAGVESLIVNPDRPGRRQLRVRRRRPKHFPLLTRPRRQQADTAYYRGR